MVTDDDEDPGGGLRFQLLGPVRCWDGDDERDLGTARQKAVLAVLALTPGRVVPVERIVAAIWADEPPVNGQNVVQKYVLGLRRVLEPDRPPRSPGRVVVLSDSGYLLAVAPDAVDVTGFRRRAGAAARALRAGQSAEALTEAAGALRAWQGEPLVGLPGPWFEAARRRLADTRADALESWAAAQLELGHPDAVLPALSEQVAAYPLRERSCELLMLALHRCRRTAEALEVFRQAREQLVEQAGLEPSEHLRSVQQRLLRDDPPSPPVPAPSVPPPVAPVAGRSMSPAAGEGPAGEVPPGPAPMGQGPWGVAVAGAAPWGVAVAGAAPWGAGPWGALPAPPGPGAPLPAVPRSRVDRILHWAARAGVITLKLVATVVPLITFGIASWTVVLMFALLRRSWLLAAASVGYFVLDLYPFVVLGAEEPADDLNGGLALGVLLLVALGGGLHAGVLAFGPLPRPDRRG